MTVAGDFPVDDLLFSSLDGYQVMEGQKQSLRNAIASAPENYTTRSDEEVVDEFVRTFQLEVPELIESGMQTSEREVDIDVSRDPRRHFFDEHPDGFYLKGIEITVHIPFKGEAALFDVRPNMFSSSMPRGRVDGQELLISFRFPHDSPPQNLKVQIEGVIQQVQQYLKRLREMAAILNNELKSIALSSWQSRKNQFAQKSSLLAGLGLPIRRDNPEPLAISKSAARTPGEPLHPKWDAFISHASEDKDSFVKPLADALRAAGLRVWYDEFRLSWGDSLRAKIDEGLSKSRFGIVVLSPSFFSKHWPLQELNGLAAREVQGVKVILPIWHDIDRKDVSDQSPMLADRVAIRSSDGFEKIVKELRQMMG